MNLIISLTLQIALQKFRKVSKIALSWCNSFIDVQLSYKNLSEYITIINSVITGLHGSKAE